MVLLAFRLNKNKPVAENLAKISAILKKYNPDYPSDFVFADEDHARQFIGEQHTGKLAALFAGLAIFISCFGLYALASYMAANRIKEIGVRKVLGSFGNVYCYTAVKRFSQARHHFFHHCFSSSLVDDAFMAKVMLTVSISVGGCLSLPALLSVMIALITISFQAIKAALQTR